MDTTTLIGAFFACWALGFGFGVKVSMIRRAMYAS